jgi:hypothetical protein
MRLLALSLALFAYLAAPAHAGDTYYWHNGSYMRVSSAKTGSDQYDIRITYVRPSPTMSGLVGRDQLLFSGTSDSDGNDISGTAYVFKEGCEPVTYSVSGSAGYKWQSITLDGDAPFFGSGRRRCEVMDYGRNRNSVLVFTSAN